MYLYSFKINQIKIFNLHDDAKNIKFFDYLLN